jgi:hypothetical protein
MSSPAGPSCPIPLPGKTELLSWLSFPSEGEALPVLPLPAAALLMPSRPLRSKGDRALTHVDEAELRACGESTEALGSAIGLHLRPSAAAWRRSSSACVAPGGCYAAQYAQRTLFTGTRTHTTQRRAPRSRAQQHTQTRVLDLGAAVHQDMSAVVLLIPSLKRFARRSGKGFDGLAITERPLSQALPVRVHCV